MIPASNARFNGLSISKFTRVNRCDVSFSKILRYRWEIPRFSWTNVCFSIIFAKVDRCFVPRGVDGLDVEFVGALQRMATNDSLPA